MERHKTKLLCTFADRENLDKVIDSIDETFESLQKIFVFCNAENQNDCYLTFNTVVPQRMDFTHFIPIHRKKDYNTLYSVNALNCLIIELNNGMLDKKFKVDWSEYQDMLLLSRKNQLVIIKTVLDDVIEFEQ